MLSSTSSISALGLKYSTIDRSEFTINFVKFHGTSLVRPVVALNSLDFVLIS